MRDYEKIMKLRSTEARAWQIKRVVSCTRLPAAE
jgi:hypothetical protein